VATFYVDSSALASIVTGWINRKSQKGYKLIFKLPTEELLMERFDEVPDDLAIPFSLSLIYMKKSSK
jgi:hypothetical protein